MTKPEQATVGAIAEELRRCVGLLRSPRALERFDPDDLLELADKLDQFAMPITVIRPKRQQPKK